MLALIRVLYASAAAATDSRRLASAIETRLGAGSAVASSSSDTVPLPLAPETWIDTIFKGTVAPDRLLYAILSDKRASLLYYGLMSLDDATLEYFDSHRPLLAAIYDQGVGAFATCARSVHVKDGLVVLPGGAESVPAWEDIVGERVTTADRFVLSLVSGDEGRRAYFLDIVTHVDPARQAFALAAAEPGRRSKLTRSLYDSTVEFEHKFWRIDLWPFARLSVDPAMLLMQVQALPDGRMAPPSSLAFWRAALDGNESACERLKPEDANTRADAAWLVARVMREPADTRRLLLNAVLFAQRVFSRTSDADAPSTCHVVANFRRFDGLMFTLERIGFSDPADYAAALQLARAVGAHVDPQNAVLGAAQMQGILSLLGTLATRSQAGRDLAQKLARSLCALAGTRPGATPSWVVVAQREARDGGAALPLDRLAQWTWDALLARLCHADESADVCLQAAAAGLRSNSPSGPIIEWEDQRYRVDPAFAASLRLSHVRQRQGALSFDTALKLYVTGIALRDQPFTKEAAGEQAAFLQGLADSIDVSGPTPWGRGLESARSFLQRTARQLASARQRPATAAADVLEASHVLLADAWASFAYAMAIGDAESSFLLADDPARRHDYGITPSAPADLTFLWRLAQEEWHQETGWKIKGSLLGLERACALSWPRRLSVELVAVRPTLGERDIHGFAQSVAALNPLGLVDEGRTSIVTAIARGRAMLNTAATEPEAFSARAAAIGISEWRMRAVIWAAAHDPKAVADMLALVDMMWLGAPDATPDQIDAWGVPAAPLDGSLGVRMPRGHSWEDYAGRGSGSLYAYVVDLNLRVAIWLEETKLPASLMPGIVSYATWDLTTTAQPADVDDYLSVVRAAQALSGDHFVDYVSALTTDGTLVPISTN